MIELLGRIITFAGFPLNNDTIAKLPLSGIGQTNDIRFPARHLRIKTPFQRQDKLRVPVFPRAVLFWPRLFSLQTSVFIIL
jgi:hypothetical protein